MDEITLTLNRTITDWEWDMLTDVDFDHTSEITFHTKHGKEVKFVKESAHHEITEEEVAEYLSKNGFVVVPGDYLERLEKETSERQCVPDSDAGDTISRQDAIHLKVSHGLIEGGILYGSACRSNKSSEKFAIRTVRTRNMIH